MLPESSQTAQSEVSPPAPSGARLRPCAAFWWPRTPEATAQARAEGRKVWDPIFMCGPTPDYLMCDEHGCDAFSCHCPFEPYVVPDAPPSLPHPEDHDA